MNKLFILLAGVGIGWIANTMFYHFEKKNIRSNNTIAPIVKNTTIVKPIIKKPTTAKKTKVKNNKKVVEVIKNTTIDKYSPRFLMKSSLDFIDKKKYFDALINLKNLITQVQDEYLPEYIEDIFIKTIDSHLAEIDKPLKKIEVLTNALEFLPNHLKFHFQLANIFIQLRDYPSANYHNDFLNYNINWQKQFNTIKNNIIYAKTFSAGEIKIPITKKNNTWVISVLIDEKIANFVVDTGASMTVISDAFIKKDYKKLEKITLSTANGKINSHAVELENFTVQGVVKHNFKIAITSKKLLPQGVDGLLGSDWLNSFNFIIDAKNSSLNLTDAKNL